MRKLLKPQRLRTGDKVAAVSLSWGGAGDADILWRYRQGKEFIRNAFGLEVVETANTLKGTEYLYAHPEKRAEDLMEAFGDDSIKAVFSCIGGDDSVRILPYIDYSVIHDNPKIFMGYSDTTVAHFICLKAGVSSFYGPSILGEFAENGGMFEYTRRWMEKTLFHGEVIGNIPPAEGWTSERVPWIESNKDRKRILQRNGGYELLQGDGIARGRLIGGCIEVLEFIKGTELWPERREWKGAILFFETSEDTPEPQYIEYWLRNYASQGILQDCAGIVFGKPYDGKYYEEYKQAILKIVRTESGLADLPILYNVSFGHTSPMMVLPYGAEAEIDCRTASFSIVEPGVE